MIFKTLLQLNVIFDPNQEDNINVREHATRVFLPQPKKLHLEVTGLVFQEYLMPLFTCAAQTTSPLLAGLLEHAKVISRCPNKHIQFILSLYFKPFTGHFFIVSFYTIEIFSYILSEILLKNIP